MPPEHLANTIAGIATRSAPSPSREQGVRRRRIARASRGLRARIRRRTRRGWKSRYSRGTTCGREPRKWISGAPERKDQSSTLLRKRAARGSEGGKSRSRRERKAGKTGRGTSHVPIQRLCGGPCIQTAVLWRAMYPNSGFAAHFGSNLSQKGCLVLFVMPKKGFPTLRLLKCPVQRKVKSVGERLRSTKQPLCDSFSSDNVGKGVFGASRFAFLNRGRLAPKQSKNTSGARPERRCGLRECELGRGATQMPVRNERAQAQGTITADPLLASPPPEIAPPCARRATNRLSRTARPIGFPARQARGGGGRPREGRASSLPHRERSGGRSGGAAQPTAPAARPHPS